MERPTHHSLDREILVDPEPPVSIRHFTRVMHSYRAVILLALAAVALAYLIVATFLYVTSPAERITSQTFRLDFEGAGSGLYPNKSKFNIADIISGPILARVWQENRLSDYIAFGQFSRSVFVLESNRQYEVLAAEYQAKLADPRISPVDRERLQKEFDLKADSIAKNEYSINLDRRSGIKPMPEPLARKILLDTLNDWADFEVNQQHVIAYEVSMLSPEVLRPNDVERGDLIAAVEVLRSKARHISDNIERLSRLPGAKLARAAGDHVSLEEIRIRVVEIMRFRLEPLVAALVHSPSSPTKRAATLRFVESQLAYDQRELDAAEQRANSFRESIAIYTQPAETATAAPQKNSEPNKMGEAVMPQLSDTFLDRLMSLTSRTGDAQYRQTLVDNYRLSLSETIPLKEAVAYDTAILSQLRNPSSGTVTVDVEAASAEIDAARAELGQLIMKMNDLYQSVSRNMTPSTQLFTLGGPPKTQTVRGADAKQLALYGLLLLLVSIPIIIVLCLLHNRAHEEEATEDFIRHEHELVRSQTEG